MVQAEPRRKRLYIFSERDCVETIEAIKFQALYAKELLAFKQDPVRNAAPDRKTLRNSHKRINKSVFRSGILRVYMKEHGLSTCSDIDISSFREWFRLNHSFFGFWCIWRS